ncbi:tRNA lysidine(34) synthetase TilS [Candidatus Babeliales bacterium]|nr:tRNA lysidine(34) synthetase TilS [Candidatus Babeliales bacterium]
MLNFAQLLRDTKEIIFKACSDLKDPVAKHTLRCSPYALSLSNGSGEIGLTRPTIILGLSGGPDSVFLLYLLAQLQDEGFIKLIAAHLDHGWRSNSADDVTFCQKLCNRFGVQLISGHANNNALNAKQNGSLEELGRKLRRSFLENVMREQQANLIALAHHRQDQQETFLLRLLRGSSLAGLRCMDSITLPYIRPLLTTDKRDIVAFLDAHNIAYLTDPTNQADDFLRNRIRKYVIPALRDCDERFEQKCESTIQHLQAEDDFLKKLTLQAFGSIFDTKMHGSLTALRTCEPVIQKRLVIHWLVEQKASFKPSENFITEVLKFLLSSRGGTHQLGEHWALVKKQNSFWLKHSVDQPTL